VIIDSIFGFFADILSSLFNSLPTYTLPTEITTVSTTINTVFVNVNSLSYWFPISTIANVGIGLFAAVGVSLAVKLIRIVIGYIPTMGGSQE
jgi:hypothetical protein